MNKLATSGEFYILRNRDIGILMVVVMFGFYTHFVIVNQSQAIVKETLNSSSPYSIGDTNISSSNNNNQLFIEIDKPDNDDNTD
jgi:hypothetical protein